MDCLLALLNMGGDPKRRRCNMEQQKIKSSLELEGVPVVKKVFAEVIFGNMNGKTTTKSGYVEIVQRDNGTKYVEIRETHKGEDLLVAVRPLYTVVAFKKLATFSDKQAKAPFNPPTFVPAKA